MFECSRAVDPGDPSRLTFADIIIMILLARLFEMIVWHESEFLKQQNHLIKVNRH